jgi:pimeloyl-ACP methyl ester carboxylesterase
MSHLQQQSNLLSTTPINTPLQRGMGRFYLLRTVSMVFALPNGLARVGHRQTVETVSSTATTCFTQLKLGVDELQRRLLARSPRHLAAFLFAAALLLRPCAAFAQVPPHIPPPGIAVPDNDRQDLTSNAASLNKDISDLDTRFRNDSSRRVLLPDVEIFHKAVDWALRYNEFFETKQISFAKTLLRQGRERAEQLRSGHAPWLDATGLVVRAYQSKLDGSIQPFGLVIPPGVAPHDSKARPMYVWLAGRGEKRTELAFLSERETSPGPFTAADTIVLHPYGRFCNANKFAGEVDVSEAMDAVRKEYNIDPNRIVVAGFSMGGASTWHLATHHSGLWCAAAPGAGFAETAEFSKVFQHGEPPPEWEQKLWRWYDATVYAANLFNCPTIAYSGEIDPQKQAADIMTKYMAAEGLTLLHLIGPQTAHKYHPETRNEIAAQLDKLVARGRDPMPAEVHLTTYTLQYPRVAWVEIQGLARHWERADVRARLEQGGLANLTTTNVTALELLTDHVSKIDIDGDTLSLSPAPVGKGIALHKDGGHWKSGAPREALRKQPGLTGPVDDAFMSPFLFVRPTGKALNDKVGQWAESELRHAVTMWRDVFRGDAPVKDDKDVASEDIESKNLVLWGDPSSNKLLAKTLGRLPITWTSKKLTFAGQAYPANDHVPILIFPNPLNPGRYVLLNSGIDFRTDAYGSNAKQTPKLPDYAIVDLDTPPGPRWPGKIVTAGFFDEHWAVRRKQD